MKAPMLAAAALSFGLMTPALAADKYVLDASHSQVLFSYNHLGYSTTYGMFSGMTGEIMFDAASPENSSVTVSMKVKDMFTGWEARDQHFMSADFFDATDDEAWTFASTGIEVTGDNTAVITGDLTLNGVTKSVALDAKLNQTGEHPMAKKPWAGFDATTTLVRSEFGLGAFAPFVSDEVELVISVEAQKADS